MIEVNKVIIPAAGLGTRFMPWTKSVPKEMIPLLDKPAIHYIVQEAFNAAMEQIVMVTSGSKYAIEQYFDADRGLQTQLDELNKDGLLSSVENLRKKGQFTYVRQSEPLGLGHAVMCCEHVIGKEYFGVMLPDDIIVSKRAALDQLIRIARQEKGSVIAVQEVPVDQVSSYGVIGIKKQLTTNLMQVGQLVEKPEMHKAPSRLAIVGRYVVSHKLFGSLHETSSYATDEIQITDAIGHMMRKGEKVFAIKLEGTRYDVGTPAGWIQALLGMALRNKEYAKAIQDQLQNSHGLESVLLQQIAQASGQSDLSGR